MVKHLMYSAIIIFFLNNLVAQQNGDSIKVPFDRIFGESKLHKYKADTFITAANRKVIYSGAECTITGFNTKGRKIWVKHLPENQCILEAMMLVNPLKGKSRFRKGCELLVQYKDKQIYGVNVKTGRFYSLND